MDLTVTDLACRRGEATILRGVTFSVPSGHALILRGPNGAGKTTLLRTLAGLSQPAHGAITPDPEAIAYASHADGLKAQLTVRENLAFWAAAFGTGPAALTRAADAFDLANLLPRRAADLSAGQRRRVGLARMLLTGRPVWLLDEPTVSLDQAMTQTFAAIVRTHLSTGGTALLATHIDLGLDAPTLDISRFAAADHPAPADDPFAEAIE
ncbi:MAG: heme ABC exporter ATP-binding protein CcmA [Pseudomonadota bacterium]